MPGYEHVCPIARGGMAEVTLVVRREGSFSRPYAMKRFLRGAASDESMRDMLLEEARIAGMLRHPNVVSVLDAGSDEEGPFLVMDYVEGVSLADLLAAHPDELPVQVCLRILTQVARGLSAAHELKSADGSPLELVHRDVSPSNVLLDLDGVARVADFGIARAVGRTNQTQTGVLKGKIAYMAPEQLRFEPIDQRADLFSLGVLAYELFAGRRLYREEDPTLSARRILHEPPPDLGLARPDAPDELTALLFRLLAKDASHRPPSARAVADQLELVLAETVAFEGAEPLDAWLRERVDVGDIAQRREQIQLAAEPTTRVDVASPPGRGRRMPMLAAAAAVVLLAIGGVAWLVRSAAAPEAPARVQEGRPSPQDDPEPPAPPSDLAGDEPAPDEPEPSVAAEATPAAPVRRRRRRARRRDPDVPVIDVY